MLYCQVFCESTCNAFPGDNLGTGRQSVATMPPYATRGIGDCHFDNLRCHQRRQSRHHDNSRSSADVLRVEIFAKANLLLAQVPPPRRRDVKSASSVVLSSLDLFSMPMRACRNAPEPIPDRSVANCLGPILARYVKPACIVHWFACNTWVIIFGI